MPYYIRLLTPSDKIVPVSAMEASLRGRGVDAKLGIEVGSDDDWEQLLLLDGDENELAVIERNPVAPEQLGEEELEEFREEIGDALPASAARWLIEYFDSVKTIYAFQLLSAVCNDAAWAIVGAAKCSLWEAIGGIFQADAEGFSNEDGYHILWQFSDDVEGTWAMAVLDEQGQWLPFTMELGNAEHRKAFLAGRIPPDVAR